MWVREDHGYREGTVHLLNGDVVRRDTGGFPTRDTDNYGRVQGFIETALTKCGSKLSSTGHTYERSPYPKDGLKRGGLRLSEVVSLNTKNICTRCRKVVLDANPSLRAAFDLLSKVKA